MTSLQHLSRDAVSPLLSVRNLTAELPRNMDRSFAVNRVSFDLMPGEILCVVGESGSGKSVTANTIMGLLPPKIRITQGEIQYRERDLLRLSETQLRKLRGKSIAMIFQDPLSALNPLMPIGRQVLEVLETHSFGDPATRSEKVVALLREVGMPAPEAIQYEYPFRLSGGQRQRVMIAMALALDPDILIADEPTTALDVTTQAQILNLIRSIQARKNIGVLFITHDFGVVAEIADKIVVMRHGEVVEQGDADVVLRNPAHPYTRALINAVPRLRTSDDDPGDAPRPPKVLEVMNLVKGYSSFRALDGVSFEVRRGQTLGVVGESGSGKSTLGRLITKLDDSTSGNILFEGKDIAQVSEKEFRPLRSKIQMIFQDPFGSLNPRHTVRRILTAGPLAQGVPLAEAIRDAEQTLNLVGLDPSAMNRFPHEFSGGQRQRVGIGRALMLKPDVLVADECVSALDVSIQASILALLDDIKRKTDVAIVFITHDLRVASQICDDLIVMHQGRIVERGTPRAVLLSPQHEYTRTLVSAIPGGSFALGQ
ncbi:ABC transporter ATP-binding protein [Aminobacter sp. UC22_36]|uniref:ABC transporter ATP-binding protein n=1 Tax=Aminobacter sp. UC22_36 TaxID=3374549 RepID=UPI0037570947